MKNNLERLEYLQADVKCKRHEMKLIRRRANKDLQKEYRTMFILMNIMVGLCIIFNFGAIILTNIMLSEEYKDEEPIRYEVNPITAKVGDFKTIDDIAEEKEWTPQQTVEVKRSINKDVLTLLYATVFWIFLLSSYIWFAHQIHTPNQMMLMLFVVTWYFTFMGADFWNNFGIWIGDMMFR